MRREVCEVCRDHRRLASTKRGKNDDERHSVMTYRKEQRSSETRAYPVTSDSSFYEAPAEGDRGSEDCVSP